MFGFIKRLFGFAASSSDKKARDKVALPAQPPVVVPARPLPAARADLAVVMQRDEIIDAQTRICGYRFSARRPDSAQRPDAASTLEILSANNVASFAERRLALIPVLFEDWASFDFQPLIGPNTVFLLSLPVLVDDLEAWRRVAAEIRTSGARLALALESTASCRQVLLGDVDFLLIDFAGYSLANFEQTVESLRAVQPALQFIVENVGKWPEHRYCIACGVAYCMGSFTTAADEAQQNKEISESRLVLMEMLNQLRKDAELSVVAQVAKRDPGVIVKLVGMANSPLYGLRVPVSSIDQALMVLGREQLHRWLAMAIFRAGSASPRDEVLLELALTRGRFLELVAQGQHSKAECDELFMLGLLSLLDCLFGIPMASVAEHIHLTPALSEVLLRSSGPLGRYLVLVIAVEKGRVEHVARLAEQLGLSLASIESASTEAMAWAEDAVRLSA